MAGAVTRRVEGDQKGLMNITAGILSDEFAQRRIAQATQIAKGEDRLALTQQFNVDEVALAVDGNQEIHRRPFEAGEGSQVDRFEDISHRPGLLLQRAGERPDGYFAQFLLDLVRRPETAFDVGFFQIASQGQIAGQKNQCGHGQSGNPSRPEACDPVQADRDAMKHDYLRRWFRPIVGRCGCDDRCPPDRDQGQIARDITGWKPQLRDVHW
ncbi:hypothetical protein D3C85_1044120 [compost metagenome]